MLCCSIAAFILSQLYAGLMGLRALFFGAPDDFVPRSAPIALMPRYSRSRLLAAMTVGMIGLSVAWGVGSAGTARAAGWVPVATSFCGRSGL